MAARRWWTGAIPEIIDRRAGRFRKIRTAQPDSAVPLTPEVARADATALDRRRRRSQFPAHHRINKLEREFRGRMPCAGLTGEMGARDATISDSPHIRAICFGDEATFEAVFREHYGG